MNKALLILLTVVVSLFSFACDMTDLGPASADESEPYAGTWYAGMEIMGQLAVVMRLETTDTSFEFSSNFAEQNLYIPEQKGTIMKLSGTRLRLIPEAVYVTDADSSHTGRYLTKTEYIDYLTTGGGMTAGEVQAEADKKFAVMEDDFVLFPDGSALYLGEMEWSSAAP